MDIKNVRSDEAEYPRLLKNIPHPPSPLYYIGELFGENEIRIAVVGTRKATENGRLVARDICRGLAERGITVVSGLAMGIDTAAHEGALLGGGRTVAVLANGLDLVYPYQNQHLARKILNKGGALFSEYPAGTPALPHQFLERNRIVSGLSLATVVIEAPAESGALVTARLAAEQGREVFVAAGAANDPNYRGSHGLIRDGARLIASLEDICEDLNLASAPHKPAPEAQAGTDDALLNIIKKHQPVSREDLVLKSGMSAAFVNQRLTMLSLNGLVDENEFGYRIKQQ